MTDSYDRLIFIVVLQFVLFENKIDLYITKRNDTLFKNLNTVALNANINIFTDFFFAFVILCYNKKIRLDASTVLDYNIYGFYGSQVAWVMTSYFAHAYQIMSILHNDIKQTALMSLVSQTNENFVQIFVITILTMCLTSPLIYSVCQSISFWNFCLRMILYTCHACARFYMNGLANHHIGISMLSNSSLFGWMFLVPSQMVYFGFVAPVMIYICIFSTILRQKNTLPIHIPANPLQNNEEKSSIQSDDFLLKLKNMEKSQGIESGTKAKRRQGSMF